MNKKNIIITLTKNFFVGFMIILGWISALIWVAAFESLTSNPSDAWNQSLASPILSKIGWVFDRDTMSLEAIADWMVNWKDCEFKSQVFWSATAESITLTCTAWYALVDHSCNGSNTRGYASSAVRSDTHCRLTWINSLYLRHQQYTTNARWQWEASIKCCKYLVP